MIIAEIHDEICQLRNTITFCEGQILRKQIALVELLEKLPAPEISLLHQSKPGSEEKELKVPMVQMIGEVLDGLAAPFGFGAIKDACVARYPEHKEKISRGIYPAAALLIKKNILQRVPGGLAKV